MNKKGISPIIAAVLLLAVTVSVVAIFSGWAPSLAQTITQETTNSTIETLECEDASVEIESAFHDGEDLIATVRNTDRADLPELTVAAFNENNQVTKQNTVNLSAGELDDVEIENVEEPAYIQAFSQNCPNVQHELNDITL